MKLILTLLLLIPSLSWGLTFKDGKQVEENSKTLVENQNNNSLQKDKIVKKAFDISLKLDVAVNEVYFNNLGDLNNDNVEDFLVSFMINPSAYGAAFYKIDAKTANELPLTPIYLFYSNENGYEYSVLPQEVWSKRMWAAKSFNFNGKNFILLGRNGEVGMPEQNPGEKVSVLEVNFSNNEPIYSKIYKEKNNSVTAWVDTFVHNNEFYLLISNYNNIKKYGTGVYDSSIFKFDEKDELTKADMEPSTKSRNAHNTMIIKDIDGDNKLDFMAAMEIWKTHDKDALFKTTNPGSYIIFDWLSEEPVINKTRILLDPLFNLDHAGFAINSLKIDNKQFFIEISGRFMGHSSNQLYKESNISFYNFTDIENLNKDYLKNKFRDSLKNSKLKDRFDLLNENYFLENKIIKIIKSFDLKLNEGPQQSKIFFYDIDKDKNEDVIVSIYQNKKMYFSLQNNEWVEKKLPFSLINNSGKRVKSELLFNKKGDCALLVSAPAYLETKNIRLHFSECL